MGARKIGVTTLPPMGCVPAAITLFGAGNNMCVDRLNYDALSFNRKLNSISMNLQNRLPGLRLIVLDIYHPLYNIIQNPADNGQLFYHASAIKFLTHKINYYESMINNI